MQKETSTANSETAMEKQCVQCYGLRGWNGAKSGKKPHHIHSFKFIQYATELSELKETSTSVVQ